MTRERLEPGEYRYVRLFSPGYLTINCLLAGFGVGLAMAAVSFQIAAGAAGQWSWAGLVMNALGLLMCGAIITVLWRGARADRRLAGVPRPHLGERMMATVKPKTGVAFAMYLGWSALCLIAGAYLLYRDDLWRIEVDPRLLQARRNLEWVGAPASMFEVDEGERLATIGVALTALSWCLWLAALGTLTAVWLWTNRRRDFLWFSTQGIGYLPSRTGDRGYRIWADVATVEHVELMEGRAFWTTGHQFIVVTTDGAKAVVHLHSGLKSSREEFAALLAEVAPHVERIGIDPDGNAWGDAVPQRKRT